MKVSQHPQKPLGGSNQIWAMTSGKKDMYSDLRGHSMYIATRRVHFIYLFSKKCLRHFKTHFKQIYIGKFHTLLSTNNPPFSSCMDLAIKNISYLTKPSTFIDKTIWRISYPYKSTIFHASRKIFLHANIDISCCFEKKIAISTFAIVSRKKVIFLSLKNVSARKYGHFILFRKFFCHIR